MDFDVFQVEYQSRFRKLTKDENTVWPGKIAALDEENVMDALGVLEARQLRGQAEGIRVTAPKIGAILAEVRKTQRRRQPEVYRKPCEMCCGGEMVYYGAIVGGRVELGEYREGVPHSWAIPCLCDTGKARLEEGERFADYPPRRLQVLREHRQKIFDWRANEMPTLIAELGAGDENGLPKAMAEAYRKHRELEEKGDEIPF